MFPKTMIAESVLNLPKNVALGKPCEFSHATNYAPCKDSDDLGRLTDGQRTDGWFWTQKSTVGWDHGQPTLITIDLGHLEPIGGITFSTAAGASDVHWPSVLMLMVSDDAKQWHVAGDLVALSSKYDAPPELGYAKFTYRTNELRTYGRYVKIGIVPSGTYSFVDEIEVLQGASAFLDLDRGPGSNDPMANLQAVRITSSIVKQLQSDIDGVRASIASGATPVAAKAMLIEQADQLAASINEMPNEVREGFKAVLPMNDLQRSIFGLQAETWRAQGKETLRVWKNHRWDLLRPAEEPSPTAKPPSLRVDLLSGEHRADVLNLTSAAKKKTEVRIRIEGLPGGTNPPYVTPHEVLCIGTRHLGAIASPLPLMKRVGDDFVMKVASGMTRQIWLDFHPTDVPLGRYHGKVSVQWGTDKVKQVPVELVVWSGEFPKQPRLLLGGWSYTNADQYQGLTKSNRDVLIDFLEDHHVNSPWATSKAMPTGSYDTQGKLTKLPDTANFDAWVQRWPNAKRYMVYVGVGGYEKVYRNDFAGSKPGTDLFHRKLAAWAHFWADHMRELGLNPSQLCLLLFDEPVKEIQFDLQVTWAAPIRKAEPEILLMVDPQFRVQDDTYLPMMEAVDELVANRLLWQSHADWFPPLFASQRQQGRQLGFYNCSGPARSFDPYAYYLLQAWHTFHIGGVYSGYWSFSDTRGTDPWNDYSASSHGSFCPMYLLESDVMTDKRMEAIREGSQDYECLLVLHDQIEKLQASGATSPALTSACKVMRRACEHVLEDFTRTTYQWDEPADRTRADRMRVTILKASHAISE